MTVRIVRVSRGGSDVPRAALSIAAYALAYLAWTDFGRLFPSFTLPSEWTLATLFAAVLAGPGVVGAFSWAVDPETEKSRTNLGIAALAAAFAVVPPLLGGRIHLGALGTPIAFGAACLGTQRLLPGARPYALWVLATVLAALTASGRGGEGAGEIALVVAASVPSIWLLLRGENSPAPALFLGKMSAVLLGEVLLRSAILPWNGVRGALFWVLLAAGTSGTAALVRGVTRVAANLDRFSLLALSTGSLLVFAVGRRLHDMSGSRTLVLMATIAAEFVAFIFLGLAHLRSESEVPATISGTCVVPLLDRRLDVALENRLAR